MNARKTGRPPIFEQADSRHLVELRGVLRDGRWARTPYEAARYLATCHGLREERDVRAFAERLRRKLNRQLQETAEQGETK